ncbi:ABC transporter permease [Kribbella qitaiheensis]|uniref:ABC transporter permease n=1 Tax=Kribbella qitaiheensis TaxID=1544730 RepID=A0A7G6X0C7_9ACTN|nr:ABC transporter permease [Kribbella qitaiheensis]QNE19692.1 ABC transporter permease [Kribbella qitaiheensis]
MSTPVRSTYPVPVEDLIPAARELTAELGNLPSRNRIMKEYRIGADKARTILDALTEPTSGPAEPHLRSVPDPGDAGRDDAAAQTPAAVDEGASPQVTAPADLGMVAELTLSAEVPAASPSEVRLVRSWPVLLLALPAFVAVWSGWVGLGELTGFGVVHPLPGIADGFTINSAITLPIGVETYAAFALRVWLSGRVPISARRFAKWSALSALLLGALGQVAYHLLEAAGVTRAPWQITTVVACLPVAVLGMGAALAHLIHARPAQKGDN